MSGTMNRGGTGGILRLFFPQGQGAGEVTTLPMGARRIREEVLGGLSFESVSPRECVWAADRNIHARGALLGQLREAVRILEARRPERILTVGGDCGVEPAPVGGLKTRWGRDMAVLWFDAHGDLNRPEESPSRLYHGMPLRLLLGEGDPDFLSACPARLEADRVALVGLRDLDPPEEALIAERGIRRIPVGEPEAVLDRIRTFLDDSRAKRIYVHVDLDVMDPGDFPHVLVPAPGGFPPGALLEILEALRREREWVGFGVTEYAPPEEEEGPLPEVLARIVRIASAALEGDKGSWGPGLRQGLSG